MKTKPSTRGHADYVEITWEDSSHARQGWHSMDEWKEFGKGYDPICSVGIVIYEDEKHVLLSADCCLRNSERARLIRIPVGMVTRRRKLGKVNAV